MKYELFIQFSTEVKTTIQEMPTVGNVWDKVVYVTKEDWAVLSVEQNCSLEKTLLHFEQQHDDSFKFISVTKV